MPNEPAELEPALQAFIGRMGLLVEAGGGPETAGRILGYLLVARDPVQSSAEIAAALQTSSGSVSTNTRQLMQVGILERIAVPQRRGAFFRIKPGAWDTTFEARIHELRAFREAFDIALAALDPADVERRARLVEAREFYAFMEEELPGLLKRWGERRASGAP